MIHIYYYPDYFLVFAINNKLYEPDRPDVIGIEFMIDAMLSQLIFS
jgi:hypothetical protein